MRAELLEADRELLLRLLRMPTAGPLETGPDGPPPQLWEAQRAYAGAAAGLRFVPVHHATVRLAALRRRHDVPLAVSTAAARIPSFLDDQPSLVLRLGPPLPQAATVMFNVHLDTVSGLEQVDFDGTSFHGRGAIDAKGPAVALLAGIRAALAAEPAIGTDISVLIQAVSGEEGGAMGTIGTRPLIESGFVGRLNLFCEPTGRRYLPRTTAAATARVRVEGTDAIDDRPAYGHNATVLLGFLAQHLGLALASRAADGGVCIAGLHTGRLHNRVYGTGELLVNLSYAAPETGRRLEAAFAAALRDGLAEFARRFASTPEFALTAAEATSVTRLEWLKRGLPTLANTDPWCEALLAGAGLERWPAEEPAFTCDAIWMNGVPGAFTAVLGPGDLAANHAHACGEFAELAELERFAADVARILVGFARNQGSAP